MRNPLSAPTIAELFLTVTAANDDRFDEFFPYIRLPNGTFKTTKTMRHVDVDETLCELLREKRRYRILDLAVSSGTGTVELADRLADAGIEHVMFGTDLSMHAECRRVPPMTILSDENGFLYQVDFAGLAFPNTPPSKLSSLMFCLAKGLRMLHRCFVGEPKRIRLLSRKAASSGIVFETGDIFGSLIPSQYESQFDVIRASNILNLSYFSSDQIVRALTNIRKHLRDQGLLVANRTSDATNHFTIFRLQGSQFTVLRQGNNGSEITDLVLGLAKRDRPPGD